MDETRTATGGTSSAGVTAQERYDLIRIEGPIEFSAVIKTSQHRYTQTIVFDPVFVFRDVDQLHQQTILDKGHQKCFGDFTKMATKGTEQATFRRHDDKTKRSKRSF